MPKTAAQLLDDASRARREHRLDDAQRDLTVAVALCRQAGARRELVRALESGSSDLAETAIRAHLGWAEDEILDRMRHEAPNGADA